jgi:cyclic pyranopterin phosphate synthase
MPEEMQFMPRAEVLTFEEITRVVRIVAEMGVNKVRLTGGEPLVRRDVPELVRQISAIEGIQDLAMTTNGILLPQLASKLKAAGLRRLNVSLDSMDRDTFAELTRRDALDKVLAGIDAALDAGFTPLKINAVAMRDTTGAELLDFARFARERPVIIRFIEFMPLDGDELWSRDQILTGEEIVERIGAVYPLDAIPGRGSQPAQRYRFRDGKGEIGVIATVTEPFCDSCDRIRLTADGKLRNCLFALDETDLRVLLRGDANDNAIAEAIKASVWSKWRGHLINQTEFTRPERSMSQIGG